MGMMAVQIDGLDELLKRYKRSPEIVTEAFKKAIQKAVRGVEAAAKPITPIDTGFLRNSISSSMLVEELGGKIIATAPYASYVHEGTEVWPLSVPPKNSGTVRQFFLEAVNMTEVDREGLWRRAAEEVVNALAK